MNEAIETAAFNAFSKVQVAEYRLMLAYKRPRREYLQEARASLADVLADLDAALAETTQGATS